MSLDRKAVQRELDLAAEEMEKLGYMDLAQHVDRYTQQMMAAEDKSIPMIYRALRNICTEAERRNRNRDFERASVNAEDVKKRIAMIKRRAMAKKILAERKAAAQKKAEDKVAPAAAPAPAPEAKVVEDPSKVTAAKNRLDRIRRLNTPSK